MRFLIATLLIHGKKTEKNIVDFNQYDLCFSKNFPAFFNDEFLGQ